MPESEAHPTEAEHPPEERTPEEPHAPAEEQVERRKVQLKDGMLRIPGGEFSMGYEGSSPGEPNERPIHVVKVAPFWIDRTEVTAEDMRACIDRGDCALRLGKGPHCTVDRPEPKLPINCVPWQSADAYCRAVGKRLPTEAEWELAAGGGQKARYPWGSAPASCTLDGHPGEQPLGRELLAARARSGRLAPQGREPLSGSRTCRATSRNGSPTGTPTATSSSLRSRPREGPSRPRLAPPSAWPTCSGAGAG